jgi:DNA-binding NtrC family response regulator
MSRILVIDDEQDIRILAKEFLSRDGHQVDLAENGRVGLKLTRLHVYDLVITDIVMPEQDGLEVITELKRLFPLLRIIVMTGGAARLDIAYLLKMALLMKVERALPKPLNFENLQGIVKEILAMP